MNKSAMKKVSLTIIILIFVISVASAQERAKIKIDVSEGPNPWNNLNVNNSDATFQFAIVTDRTGGHRPGVFLDGVKKLNLLQPEFVMSVGDLIEGYTEDTAKLTWQWSEFNGFIDSLKMPFFYVPGNHDITNQVMEKKWEELHGKTFYHFTYKEVLFLCLNSEDNYRGAGRGTIDDEQYDYIKSVLDENASAKWTLVFMHQPLWNQDDTKRWKDVEKLLEDRKHTVFVGHNHRYRKYSRNNGKYFVLATTGGGSSLRGTGFGEFDHVVWITMTDNGPIMANLLLEGIWDENVMTEDLADFIYPLAQNLPITLRPIFIDQSILDSLSTEVKISNDSEKKMNAEIRFLASKNLIVDPVAFAETIEPNDVRTVNLNLKGVNIEDLNKMDGLKMEVNFAYEFEDRKDIELKETYTIRPAIKYKIAPISGKIDIDGDLKEWKKWDFKLDENSCIDASPFTHTGSDDAFANFSVSYDNEFLYVAAQITDDEISVTPGGNPLYQDAAMIFIDPRPADNYNRTSRENLFSDWMVIAVSPDEEGSIYQKKRLPEGTKCQVRKTGAGYDVEVAIPLKYLNDRQLGEWKNVRINMMINDYDQGGNHTSEISWKPLWIEQDNYLGSGTFFR
jgi:predicted phosphodiesterase